MRLTTVMDFGLGLSLTPLLTDCKTTPSEPKHINLNCEPLRDQIRQSERHTAVLDRNYDPDPFYFDCANNDIGHRQVFSEAKTKIDLAISEINAAYNSLKCN